MLSASLINSAVEEMNRDEMMHNVIPKKETLCVAGAVTSDVPETSPVFESEGRFVSSRRFIVVNSSSALSAVLARDCPIFWLAS